jgi:hypothetical protein
LNIFNASLVTSEMHCRECSSIIRGHANIEHPEKRCPILKNTYCSTCCVYGHSLTTCSKSFKSCPNIDSPLEVYSPLKFQYSKSMTLVSNTDASVRAALIANEIVPMTCQEKGKKVNRDFIENKKRLTAFLKKKDLTLVLINPK